MAYVVVAAVEGYVAAGPDALCGPPPHRRHEVPLLEALEGREGLAVGVTVAAAGRARRVRKPLDLVLVGSRTVVVDRGGGGDRCIGIVSEVGKEGREEGRKEGRERGSYGAQLCSAKQSNGTSRHVHCRGRP